MCVHGEHRFASPCHAMPWKRPAKYHRAKAVNKIELSWIGHAMQSPLFVFANHHYGLKKHLTFMLMKYFLRLPLTKITEYMNMHYRVHMHTQPPFPHTHTFLGWYLIIAWNVVHSLRWYIASRNMHVFVSHLDWKRHKKAQIEKLQCTCALYGVVHTPRLILNAKDTWMTFYLG